MKRLFGFLSQLSGDERGNVAMMFGLTLIPVAGMAGFSLDYSRASNARQVVQSEVDSAALAIARAGVEVYTSPANTQKSAAWKDGELERRKNLIVTAAQTNLQTRMGSDSAITNLSLSGNWADYNKAEFRLIGQFKMKNSLAKIVPGTSSTTDVSVKAVGWRDVRLLPFNPQITRPGYEAGDYNRIYAYCFDKDRVGQPDKGRRDMRLLSTNGQTINNGVATNDTTPLQAPPTCMGHETLSYRLYNVRDARTTPSKWPENGAAADRYNYYSDTVIDPVTGAMSFQFNGAQLGYNGKIDIMETVICDTKQQCTPNENGNSPNTQIPNGKNRVPLLSNKACAPGKFLYLGFEDRPYIPGKTQAQYDTWGSGFWTDRDHEDIRMVIECPNVQYQTQIKLTE
jgi:Flp pilus assembly protein TadG